jgi:hypothetical protein
MKLTVEIHREHLKPSKMKLGKFINYSWTQGIIYKYVVIETYNEMLTPMERRGCVDNALKQVFARDLEHFVKEYNIDSKRVLQ